MTWKAKVAELVGDAIYYGIPKKKWNYHVSSRNFLRSKPDSAHLFDFSILSLWNTPFPEKLTYDRALKATRMEYADNLSKRFRQYTLFQLVERSLLSTNMRGDVVELGCWQGQSAYGIADTLRKNGFKNRDRKA